MSFIVHSLHPLDEGKEGNVVYLKQFGTLLIQVLLLCVVLQCFVVLKVTQDNSTKEYQESLLKS